jgi:glycerol-3-phosphate dehydrogenase (NAD(P)+)
MKVMMANQDREPQIPAQGKDPTQARAMNLCVLGAGAWGTALAMALAERHDVLLWGRNEAAMQSMAKERENRSYLPNFRLPDNLHVTADFDAAILHAIGAATQQPGLLIAACPVAALRPLAQRLLGYPIANLVWLCKGFEVSTGLLPHQVVQEVFGAQSRHAGDERGAEFGALSGPSFAQEVAAGLPCALTIASTSAALRERVVAAVHGGAMRVYTSDDVIGVEVGGAVKNILAIATGVADGLGLGLNARAALITRGLAEITRLGIALGGRSETFMGLTGIGDLILTCTGDLSRNRKVGLALAQGKRLDVIVAELGHVAEGVPCARAVRALAAKLGIEMPLTDAVASIVFDGGSARDIVAQLLSRDSRNEAA